MDPLSQLLQLAIHLDRSNAYIPPHVAMQLRNHGFPPHRSYMRPPSPPPRPQCPALTQRGTQCVNKCAENMTTCRIHCDNPTPRPVPLDQYRCPIVTLHNEQCKCPKFKHFPLCWGHAKRAGILPPPPEVPSECSICYTDLSENRVKTSCGHYFHHECFESWKTSRVANLQSVTCPMCRHVRPNPRPA